MQTLIGITFNNLKKLLKENRFSIKPKYIPQLLYLTLISMLNSRLGGKEKNLYQERISSTNIQFDPVFILGHWRSGTTLLHKLLSLDEQFNYPSVFQIYNPSTFLYTEPRLRQRLEKLPSQKRPMDNVKIRFDDPGEEEFAVSVTSLKSPVLGWVFPQNIHYYDRFLTFKNCTQTEIEIWKKSLIEFLKKLTVNKAKQLVLKSPANTGRIKLLLELFPKAKFIHLHRHPYAIFRSTLNLYWQTISKFHLQDYNDTNLIKDILNRYEQIEQSYFEEREELPQNQLVELGFEEFETDRLNFLKRIYQKLELGDFQPVKYKFETYLNSINKYQKNIYENNEPWHKQVAEALHRSFVEWNYKP